MDIYWKSSYYPDHMRSDATRETLMFHAKHFNKMTDFWLQAEKCQILTSSGHTQQEIANQLGISRAEVSHLIRFNRLTPEVVKLLKKHAISRTHIRLLVTVSSYHQQKYLIGQIINKGLSTRSLKEVINLLSQKSELELLELPADELNRALALRLGLPVIIKPSEQKDKESGIIALSYKNKDDYKLIIRKLLAD
ncbi:hypothetical protein H0A36_17685 [Endozoicomonas sp. SM1973]|uniref:ParB/Spo0J HTH domain-containing protein n=1 Tax=Spartinivicinus marinus TaxID=2994442 RepID=A0A853I570_9GAMM|nr:hypothetical protein [Spartinivicinus marinus]MCX4030206.1 hypothetical protein [Spartinivicinus marinus]NYZ67849.1 hypothetical protein [Spartinivicinus marinus]